LFIVDLLDSPFSTLFCLSLGISHHHCIKCRVPSCSFRFVSFRFVSSRLVSSSNIIL
jgi:hypothetical protein